jgi:hypothetical protein
MLMKHWSIIKKCYNVTTTSYQWLEFFVKFAKHGASNLCLPKIWPLMPNIAWKNYTTSQQGTKLDLAPPLNTNQIWCQTIVELLLASLGHNSFECMKQRCLSLIPPSEALTFLSFLSFERFRPNTFDLFH